MHNYVINAVASNHLQLCTEGTAVSHENEKPPFSNSSSFKSICEKLRFRDGLVWTVGLTREIKLS